MAGPIILMRSWLAAPSWKILPCEVHSASRLNVPPARTKLAKVRVIPTTMRRLLKEDSLSFYCSFVISNGNQANRN